MAGPDSDANSTSVVLASGVLSVKQRRFYLAYGAFFFLFYGWQAFSGRGPLSVVMTILVAVGFGVFLWLNFPSPGIRLVLVGETLELQRRFRPVSVARNDVIAVRGDVPGRPTWSQQVLVETSDRIVRLPQLDRTPGELIPRLQEWAEVGEKATNPRRPG